MKYLYFTDASQVAAIKEVLGRISTESCLIFKDVSGTKARDAIVIGVCTNLQIIIIAFSDPNM